MTPRKRLIEALTSIDPWDALENTHLADGLAWIGSGAPLYRANKPDVPETHLAVYTALFDSEHNKLLVVNHRKAGLWLVGGGHVEVDEDPWKTVVRECQEEFAVTATPSTIAGSQPFFFTMTRTRGAYSHIDASLWYVLAAQTGSVTWFDEHEFTGIQWLSLAEILAHRLDIFDPHMHRFVHKLLAARS